MTNVVCPACRGEKGGFRIACGSGGCKTSTVTCDFCKGAGQVSAAVNALWQKGCELREARKQQGISLPVQARLLGIDVADLSAEEHGRIAIEDARRVRYDEREDW